MLRAMIALRIGSWILHHLVRSFTSFESELQDLLTCRCQFEVCKYWWCLTKGSCANDRSKSSDGVEFSLFHRGTIVCTHRKPRVFIYLFICWPLVDWKDDIDHMSVNCCWHHRLTGGHSSWMVTSWLKQKAKTPATDCDFVFLINGRKPFCMHRPTSILAKLPFLWRIPFCGTSFCGSSLFVAHLFCGSSLFVAHPFCGSSLFVAHLLQLIPFCGSSFCGSSLLLLIRFVSHPILWLIPRSCGSSLFVAHPFLWLIPFCGSSLLWLIPFCGSSLCGSSSLKNKKSRKQKKQTLWLRLVWSVSANCCISLWNNSTTRKCTVHSTDMFVGRPRPKEHLRVRLNQ